MSRVVLVIAWVVWLACTPFLARFLGYFLDRMVPPKIIWPSDPEGDLLDNSPRRTRLRGFVTVMLTVSVLLLVPAFATYALSHYKPDPRSPSGSLVGDAGF